MASRTQLDQVSTGKLLVLKCVLRSGCIRESAKERIEKQVIAEILLHRRKVLALPSALANKLPYIIWGATDHTRGQLTHQTLRRRPCGAAVGGRVREASSQCETRAAFDRRAGLGIALF